MQCDDKCNVNDESDTSFKLLRVVDMEPKANFPGQILRRSQDCTFRLSITELDLHLLGSWIRPQDMTLGQQKLQLPLLLPASYQREVRDTLLCAEASIMGLGAGNTDY